MLKVLKHEQLGLSLQKQEGAQDVQGAHRFLETESP
jgi:hypothetical protein